MEQKYILISPAYDAPQLFAGCAQIFAAFAEKETGISWTAGEGGVTLLCDASLDAEEYTFSCTPDGIQLTASAPKGMHSALADLLGQMKTEDGKILVPVQDRREKPDCSYRGLLVDVARQRHPLPYLKRVIDLCWKNRASHLQLHFTDEQSFTLPIAAFPTLYMEEYSYTREDIAELVDYADAHGIILVPEVDVPGHTGSLRRAYPEVFGTTGVLPASDEVFGALRVIFSEVAALFPHSPWIHLGGDEAAIGNWEKCETTRAYMQAHGIADIHEMYGEYVRIITDMILSMDRTPMVWEGFSKEYNDRIDKRTIVMEFESYYQLAPELAESGFTLINCSWKPLYIVTPVRHWTPEEISEWHPWMWDHFAEFSAAYNKGVLLDRKYPVLGGQLCAWGDRLAGMENWREGLEMEITLIAERLPALCARLWTL
ncbi:MAG: family 20 glycosylhydrolase [Clostridia bacterium]|nr:family 20 glycosylhydrolase [Clostridia bacterium]